MAQVRRDSDPPVKRQAKLSAQLQLLQKLITVTPIERAERPHDVKHLLINLDTIASCLATGDGGDVVAVTLTDAPTATELPIRCKLDLSRNVGPTAENEEAAKKFFQVIQNRDAGFPPPLTQVLATLHEYSAQNMEKRIVKLQQRCAAVLRLAQLRLIRTQNDNRSTNTIMEAFKNLLVKCAVSLEQRVMENLRNLKADTKRNSHPNFGLVVDRLGRAVNKICRYNIGILKLMETPRTWTYRWIDHAETSKTAIEFSHSEPRGLRVPGCVDTWLEAGVEIPNIQKSLKLMSDDQLKHLYHKGNRTAVASKEKMLKALYREIPAPYVAEVPMTTTELEARLKEVKIIGTSRKDQWQTEVWPVVHAELRMILHHDGQHPESHGKPRAIGVSKRCCATCTFFIELWNLFFGTDWLASGNHGKFYANFAIPGLVLLENAPATYVECLMRIVDEVIRRVNAILKQELPRLHKEMNAPSDEGGSDHSVDDIRRALRV